MSTSSLTDPTLTGGDLVRLTGMTDRQVHAWCMAGIFGRGHAARVGSGNSRRFTTEDVIVALACRRVAESFGLRSRRGWQFPRHVLAQVADHVRAGATVVSIRLGDHVELTVDVADLREAHT